VNGRSPRVRVAAIVREGDSVLLVAHSKEGRSYWLLPGGGVEYGETLEDALKREMKEEVCLDVEVGDLALVCDAIAPDGSKHVVNLCFETTVLDGEMRLGVDPRLSDARFVPIDDVADLELHPAMQTPLADYLRKSEGPPARYVRTQWV